MHPPNDALSPLDPDALDAELAAISAPCAHRASKACIECEAAAESAFIDRRAEPMIGELRRLRAIEARVRAEIAHLERCAAELPPESRLGWQTAPEQRVVEFTGRDHPQARAMRRDADGLRNRYLGEPPAWDPGGCARLDG